MGSSGTRGMRGYIPWEEEGGSRAEYGGAGPGSGQSAHRVVGIVDVAPKESTEAREGAAPRRARRVDAARGWCRTGCLML